MEYVEISPGVPQKHSHVLTDGLEGNPNVVHARRRDRQVVTIRDCPWMAELGHASGQGGD